MNKDADKPIAGKQNTGSIEGSQAWGSEKNREGEGVGKGIGGEGKREEREGEKGEREEREEGEATMG